MYINARSRSLSLSLFFHIHSTLFCFIYHPIERRVSLSCVLEHLMLTYHTYTELRVYAMPMNIIRDILAVRLIASCRYGSYMMTNSHWCVYISDVVAVGNDAQTIINKLTERKCTDRSIAKTYANTRIHTNVCSSDFINGAVRCGW